MDSKHIVSLVAIVMSSVALGFICAVIFETKLHFHTQRPAYFYTQHPVSAKSYYFITSKLDWYKASEYCRSRGMFLVTINNDEQLNSVIEQIEQSGFIKRNGGLHMWTSGNDLSNEGEFFWSSTGQRLTFDRWTKNEPNNLEHGSCTREDCLVLEYYQPFSINYTFDDRPCRVENVFMCETLHDTC